MTRLLVRILDADEAAAAAAADVLELRFDELEHRERAVVRSVRAAFAGTLCVGVVSCSSVATLMRDAADLGADQVSIRPATLTETGTVEAGPRPLVLVARLEVGIHDADTVKWLRGRVDRVTIESDGAARLVDRGGIARPAALADACRLAGLPFGFAGGLEAPDIPRLLVLKPDVLGIDVAVRHGHRSDGTLLPQAIEAIRALIPREDGTRRGVEEASVRDTIFVRDFLVSLSIGAYRAEEGARQRVRFSVEAVVARRAGVPRDMRDVFSYDVILETIRVLAGRAHVAFVETLAEEVATALLDHAEVRHVTVQVEKLDVVDGAVGIRIARSAEVR